MTETQTMPVATPRNAAQEIAFLKARLQQLQASPWISTGSALPTRDQKAEDGTRHSRTVLVGYYEPLAPGGILHAIAYLDADMIWRNLETGHSYATAVKWMDIPTGGAQ